MWCDKSVTHMYKVESKLKFENLWDFPLGGNWISPQVEDAMI